MLWEMPLLDMGHKQARKSAFEIYLSAQGEVEAEFQVGIETERRKRQKAFRLRRRGEQPRRIRIGCGGRRWRLVLSAAGGAPFSIAGGVQVLLDMEDD